jgi:AraC-like DNA-binding protein
VELGLQGLGNRQIARQLGWVVKTVRIYWIALGLEEQVHQAQAERRAREQQERRATLRDRVEVILESMCRQQDEEITMARVSQALGCAVFYLGYYREVADRVREVATAHNAQLKQRRYEALSARIVQAIEEAKRDGNLSALEINRRLGLSHDRLRRWYPELYTMVQQAVREYRAQMRAARVETRCAQINEAAARLVAQGISLTCVMILKEVGLGSVKNDPEVEALLRQWVRCYTPGGG